ncbi:hypothetical protein NM208_g7590 [Fusarium decemcellulare]|uniref:Uncharacterized protein n=1 Tax=Fusarium decemcellulare TaxID=57161 RepID=A0ACC1S8J6_9HYPO|nr:hypothetical protein NM208_g7590 [Fusarium decemcellulare]
MAAAATPDTVALDSFVHCLKVAHDVHRLVLAIHEGDSTSDSASRLKELSDALSASIQRCQDIGKELDGPDAGHHSIFLIKFACIKIAQDLIVHIDRVLKSPNVNDQAINVDGFCTLWPRNDVDALGSRLSQVAHQLQDLVLDADSRDMGLEQRLCTDLAAINLSLPRTPTEKSGSRTDNELNDASIDAQNGSDGKPNQNVLKLLGKNTMSAPKLAPVGLINDFILESLAYKSMYDRESEVTEAHTKTLDWIFDGSPLEQPLRNTFRDSFTTWLKTQELGPIYWITGKPGSGKSTLMRFLSQSPIATEYLRQWAAKKPVCTAGFFFWTSGSRQQRSQTGLLRYLLHQLLSSNPELISKTFPKLWGELRPMTTKDRVKLVLDWTVADLQDAFHAFLDAALSQTNICLFIDGLDEFEGDHHQIINFFRGLTLRKNGQALKMRLSSRPWTVFEKAFGTSVPSTRLQDLSHDDMCQYVTDTLRSNTQLRRLMRTTDSGHALTLATVERADGVFLWVKLAVDRLLAAFHLHSKLEILDKTLASLPTELDALFEKLLFEDQTSAEVIQTATLFQLIHAREVVADFIKDESSASLTVWELAFSLFEDDDGLALDRKVCEATDDEIRTRCGTTAKYIQDRFSGLLKMHQRQQRGNMGGPRFAVGNSISEVIRAFTDCRVIYIHRTVRDWLMEPNGAGQRLKALQAQDFDPHLRLLRSYVLRLKFPLEEIEHHRRLDEWYPDIALAMSHARYITTDSQHLQRRLLNEMDKTISWLWMEKHSELGDHWARSTFGAYEVRMKAPPIQRPFLCLATKFGLAEYVCQEVVDLQEAKPVTSDGEEEDSAPLLSYATEFLCSRNTTIFPLSSPELVRFLLDHPSDINPGPNHSYKHFITHKPTTAWLAVLRHLRDAKRRGWIDHYDVDPEGTTRWAEIVRMFIEKADINAVVKRDAWDPEITAVGVVKLLEETYGAAEVHAIRVLMEEMLSNESENGQVN